LNALNLRQLRLRNYSVGKCSGVHVYVDCRVKLMLKDRNVVVYYHVYYFE